MYLTIGEWEWVLRDGDDCLIFAQKKPIPYSFSMRHVLITIESIYMVVAVVCLLTADVVECIVAQTQVC